MANTFLKAKGFDMGICSGRESLRMLGNNKLAQDRVLNWHCLWMGCGREISPDVRLKLCRWMLSLRNDGSDIGPETAEICR